MDARSAARAGEERGGGKGLLVCVFVVACSVFSRGRGGRERNMI